MPLGDPEFAPAPQQRPAPGPLLRLADLVRPRRRLLPLSRLGSGRRTTAEAMIRDLAGGIPMGDGTLLCRTLGRHKLLVDAADQAHAPHLLLDGFWEWWTTAFLARNLRPGETVVDAGAGYGYFTLLAADLVGPAGRVLAFEPHPRLAALLRRNVALNGFADRVEVQQKAVAAADAPEPLPFLAPAGSPLDGRLAPPPEGEEEAEARAAGAVAVAATTLDSLAGRGPDLVKLDIPGAEEAAWAGMQRLLDARPGLRLLLAYDPARCESPAALLGAIAARFPLRRLDPDGRARDCSAAELLAGGEAMLFLSRAAPR